MLKFKIFIYLILMIAIVGPAYGDNTYYLPIYKCPSNYWSGLGITNLNSQANANVVATVYSQDGDILTTETKTIAANGQDNFLVGTDLNSDGWIKVTSNQFLAALNFLGEYQSGGSDYFLADVPFTGTLSQSLIIPHVAQNATWDTIVCIANPNSSNNVVTLTYTDKSGTSFTPFQTIIQAYGSEEVSMADVADSDSIKGGYVTISATQGIAAFALYNNLKTGNSSYAGINAVDVTMEKMVAGIYDTTSSSGGEAVPSVGTVVVFNSDGTYVAIGSELTNTSWSASGGRISGSDLDQHGYTDYWSGTYTETTISFSLVKTSGQEGAVTLTKR